jgi:hypothetical protein
LIPLPACRPPKFMRLHPQSDHAGHNERCSPYQVEIEPGLAKNREYKLAIDHPCDDPSDSKIGR